MKLLITGEHGFIGKNLVLELQNRGYTNLLFYGESNSEEELETFIKQASFIFHLAGVNRPKEVKEYSDGNVLFTEKITEIARKVGNYPTIIFSSSIQASLNNPYGRSKKEAEDIILDYSMETGAAVKIFRLTNVFGKWSRPNYNSVVATFCHNISNNLPIHIEKEDSEINLVYIDDVVNGIIGSMLNNHEASNDGRFYITPSYITTVGALGKTIEGFREGRRNQNIPNMEDELIKKLYSTYLSYLPLEEFAYPLYGKSNEHGGFTEVFKQESFGQVSVNVIKPGVTKGNHWHNSKVEKFVVVSGDAIIRFRKVSDDIPSNYKEYKVSGDIFKVVDIPPGYTHNISNVGNVDLITVMWANEIYDSSRPDTYDLEV